MALRKELDKPMQKAALLPAQAPQTTLFLLKGFTPETTTKDALAVEIGRMHGA